MIVNIVEERQVALAAAMATLREVELELTSIELSKVQAARQQIRQFVTRLEVLLADRPHRLPHRLLTRIDGLRWTLEEVLGQPGRIDTRRLQSAHIELIACEQIGEEMSELTPSAVGEPDRLNRRIRIDLPAGADIELVAQVVDALAKLLAASQQVITENAEIRRAVGTSDSDEGEQGTTLVITGGETLPVTVSRLRYGSPLEVFLDPANLPTWTGVLVAVRWAIMRPQQKRLKAEEIRKASADADREEIARDLDAETLAREQMVTRRMERLLDSEAEIDLSADRMIEILESREVADASRLLAERNIRVVQDLDESVPLAEGE